MDTVSFANDLMSSLNPLDLKPTHCFDLIRQMTKGIETKELHYTIDGLRAVIPHEEGVDYEVVIKPLRKEVLTMLKGSFEQIDELIADSDPCTTCRLRGLSLCIDECTDRRLYTPFE